VSELIPLITDEMLVEQSRNDEELRLARELGLRSAMVVPMRGATTIGALTLVYADESGRRFDEDDLAFAEDIAHRAGAAVENVMTAEAYRAERGASGDG
jgi:GAF domain-containing protein